MIQLRNKSSNFQQTVNQTSNATWLISFLAVFNLPGLKVGFNI